MFNEFCNYISKLTTVDVGVIKVILLTVLVLAIFSILKTVGRGLIRNKLSGKGEYVLNQSFKIIMNILELFALLLVWSEYIKNLMTLISVLSASLIYALREIILNFFCGLYIKIRRPFKVEDRIQIDNIKGDVMDVSALDFEVLNYAKIEQEQKKIREQKEKQQKAKFMKFIMGDKAVENENEENKNNDLDKETKSDDSSNFNNSNNTKNK